MKSNSLFSSEKFYCSTQNFVPKKIKFSCIHLRRRREERCPGAALCYGLSFPLLPEQTRQGIGTQKPPCAGMAVFDGFTVTKYKPSHTSTHASAQSAKYFPLRIPTGSAPCTQPKDMNPSLPSVVPSG